MILRNNSSRLQLGLVVTVLLGLLVAGEFFSLQWVTATQTEHWPPFTMEYEVNGQTSPGERPPRHVHRLEYRSKTDWTDTIIKAPSIENRYGVFSHIGTFQQVKDDVFTDYDSVTGLTSTDRIEDGTTRVPRMGLIPHPVQLLQDQGFRFVRKPTVAKVCFLDECEERAAGVSFLDEGQERIILDDVRGIPLRVGDNFVVRELRVHDSRQAIVLLPAVPDK